MRTIVFGLVTLAFATPLHAMQAAADSRVAAARSARAAVEAEARSAALHARTSPPTAWLAQDPADSLWRAARASLDNGEAREAATLYRRIRTERRFASSEYRPHAFYWEAFARHRAGGAAELRSARSVLAELRRTYPRFENMVEVERLESRIDGQLASAGDATATTRRAAEVSRAASQCPDQEIRVTVVEGLISMPSESAMPILKQVMARKDACNALLREKAVFIISQKRGAEAEDLLLDAAKSDPEPKVREQAVFWLSQVNSEKAVGAIEEILRTSQDPKMLEQAVFALSQQRNARAAQILRDIAGRQNAPAEVRKNAIFWLGQSRAADVGQFMRSLYSTTSDTETKEAILFALSQNNGADNADFLFEIAMNEREPIEMRKSALFWAGQKRALPLDRLGQLYGTMQDREMREQIIFTISQRREPAAVDQLIEIVRNERDVELRKSAIFWLSQNGDPRAVRFLADLVTG
jgi:HEAT repeat protein